MHADDGSQMSEKFDAYVLEEQGPPVSRPPGQPAGDAVRGTGWDRLVSETGR